MFHIQAQDAKAIITDRPTQSVAAATAGKGNVLLESGVSSERFNSLTDLLNVSTLVRFGISDWLECRLTGNYDYTSGDDYTASSLGTTNLGIKVFLVDADKAFADVSLLGQINLPTGVDNDEITGELRLNFFSRLGERFTLAYNLGVLASAERDIEWSPFYTIAAGYALTHQLSVFVEPYGFTFGPADHRLNAGIIYLIKNRLQLDLSGGIGLSEISPAYYSSLGISIGF